MIYGSWFRNSLEKPIPGYEEFESLDKGEGLYNKDGSNVSLIYSGDSIPRDHFIRNPSPKIIFGKKIKFIGNYAFYEGSGLTQISLPNATFIDRYAFYNCFNLTQISLPNATFIGDATFYSCFNLTQVSLPNVTFMGSHIFYNCSNLTQISLPNATTIYHHTLYGCSKLKKITCKQGMRSRIQQLIQESNLTQPIEIIEV